MEGTRPVSVKPNAPCALPALLDQLGKLREEIARIVRSRCRFGMVLDAEDRQFASAAFPRRFRH